MTLEIDSPMDTRPVCLGCNKPITHDAGEIVIINGDYFHVVCTPEGDPDYAIKDKEWIDDADYETLLHRWRFGHFYDEIFQGNTRNYYSKVMREKKALLTNAEAVAVSKRIGWEG